MFTHITVGANDVEASRRFYDAALGALGLDPAMGPDPKGRYWWRTAHGAFAVGKPIDGEPATIGNGCTIGFAMEGPEQAQAWMGCLNDVRLGLGALLLEAGAVDGVPATDIPEFVAEDDPRSAHLDVYHWLTFMQDSLCTALTGK